MPLTTLEKSRLASGERHQLVRALKANGVPTSVLLVIAAGDDHALMKLCGATGAQARMIGSGDEASLAKNLEGLV